MKKSTTLLMGALLFSSILGVTSVHADDTTEPANYTSNGVITFEPDKDPTKPVDPTDPTKPVDPVDPTKPDGPDDGTEGPLSIDYASSFNFGTQKIITTDKDYYADIQAFKDGTTGPNYVQVTDKRGSQAGWNLSVTQNGQLKTTDDDELIGASLSMTDGALISTVDNKYAPELTATNVLIPDQKAPLMNAEKGKGMGTWLYKFGTDTKTDAAKAVKLSVPGKSVKLAKEYKTTLTWSLENTPAN